MIQLCADSASAAPLRQGVQIDSALRICWYFDGIHSEGLQHMYDGKRCRAFDRDGVAAEYAVVPADVLAPKPSRLSHVEAAALPMGGLTAWQALFVHGRLARGERVLITGASGGVGHIAVQLARHAGATVVESGPVDLVFDTRGGEVPAGERVVTIAEEMPGAIYFIVEADHEQLLELRTLADAGELRAEVDSVFPLTEARAAFERVAARGKRGKVVLQVGTD